MRSPSTQRKDAGARFTPDQRWTTVLDSERLRELRRRRGMSQSELAEQAGISLRTLARLESQSSRPCRTRTLARLARALGEDPAVLLPQPTT
jgi:transcriptional regulator with XRE-family HTH domain